MAAGTRSGGGENLSLTTLVAAALAAGTAALVVSQFSESGSAMAAALTAIVVPLLREAFHRPARAISDVRPRRGGARAAAGAGAVAGGAAGAGASFAGDQTRQADLVAARLRGDHATGAGGDTSTRVMPIDAGAVDPETARLEAETRPVDPETAVAGAGTQLGEPETRPLDDGTQSPAPDDQLGGRGDGGATSFYGGTGNGAGGASSAARRSSGPSRRTLGRRPRLRIAIVTGVLAFLLAAVVLTVPELITGGSIGGGEGRTTLFSGNRSDGAGSQSGNGVENDVIDGDGSEPNDSGGGSSQPTLGGEGSGGGGDAGTPADGGGSAAPGETGAGGQQPDSSGSEPGAAPSVRAPDASGDSP